MIRGILVLDPAKRLKIDEILEHPFFAPTNGQTIPKFMPVSTLACPPSNTMLSQLSSNPGNNPNNISGMSRNQNTLEIAGGSSNRIGKNFLHHISTLIRSY